ncbi:VanZ family protein [Paenibacillus prosopidis]|uniref:Glycopeptide antibiotics resistance protein n=1 Tax=Paenibacillus prosopidis TaxID=630520 RepID=A0A368W2B4_9BACL|nr:VanZ family protein [Paenibacillus prosopidis]RCW48062.1 glycopeptide antibiotics resistance protein [Paenibacillus prosopidis]
MSIQFTIPSWSILVPLFLVLTIFFGFKTFKRKVFSVERLLLLLTFTLYFLAVLHLVFFPIEVNIGRFANQTIWYNSINFIPILTIDVKTFLLNILMMVPFGICLPLLRSKSRTAASVGKFALCVSLSLEVMQMIIRVTLGSGRSTDINDIIANTLGGVFGFLIYKRLTYVKAVRCMIDRYRLG